MRIQKEVSILLNKLPTQKSTKIIFNKASRSEIKAYAKEHNLIMPLELYQWLQTCNGISAKFGVLYGINPISPYLDMVSLLNEFPSWRAKGWIPLGSDGCGDYYVLSSEVVSGGTTPVLFIDQSDYDNADYVVASSLWKFLRFLFIDEIVAKKNGQGYWPFEKKKVIAEDPDILLCKEAPLPWEADQDDGDDDNNNDPVDISPNGNNSFKHLQIQQ